MTIFSKFNFGDPSSAFTKFINRFPYRQRRFLNRFGVIISWILLIESSASILFGLTIIRSSIEYIYEKSHPILREVLEGLYIAFEPIVFAWRSILTPLSNYLSRIFGFDIPNAAIELVILALFALRAYLLISGRSRRYYQVLWPMMDRVPLCWEDFIASSQRYVEQVSKQFAKLGSSLKFSVSDIDKYVFQKPIYIEESEVRLGRNPKKMSYEFETGKKLQQ